MPCRPIALLVRSPAVLAVVSQISVWFVIGFAGVIAVISLSPIHNSGASIAYAMIRSGRQGLVVPL